MDILLKRLNDSKEYKLIIDTQTKQTEKLQLSDNSYIKIGDKFERFNIYTVEQLYVLNTSIIDLKNGVVDLTESKKIIILLSNKSYSTYVYYLYTSWTHDTTKQTAISQRLTVDYVSVADFNIIIGKYMNIFTMLMKHNISTIVVSRESRYMQYAWNSFSHYLLNLKKNGFLVFFVDVTDRKVYDYAIASQQNNYIKQHNIEEIIVDLSFITSIADQIYEHFHGKDKIKENIAKHYENNNIGKYLFNINVHNYQIKYPEDHTHPNMIAKKLLSEPTESGAKFNVFFDEEIIQLKIIEKKYNILPHEILHISESTVQRYNKLLYLPFGGAYDYINVVDIKEDKYTFKKTIIDCFTNDHHDKYICSNTDIKNCTDFCAIINDSENDMAFATCLINNIDSKLQKNIIVITDTLVNDDDDIVIYRKR